MDGSWRALPVCSLARPGGKADVEMLKPLLNHVRRRLGGFLPLHLVVGDKGYISADRGRFLRKTWGVGLVVSPRPDMRPPEGTTSDGCPLCPLGEKLIWDDYDATDDCLLYRGCADTCQRCPLSGGCAKRFEFPASRHETFWGLIPYHSQVSRRLLHQFRPLVESGFHLSKNRFRLKDFFINRLELAQTLCAMSDLAELLKIMGQGGTCEARQSNKSTLREIIQPELWD